MHEEDLRKKLGLLIRQAREAKGWTHYEVSKRTQIGVTHLVKIEDGVYSIRIDILQKICEALDLKVRFPLK